MIISFNRYNGGGGSGSGSTDLTNYWNSAVTEQHIESAASITYASGVSYTDAAVAGIVVPDLTNYWDSAVTEEQIASAASIVYASANSYTDAALANIDLSEYALSADVETLSAATAGKADAANVTARNNNVLNRFWFPSWNEQGIIVGDGGGAAWKEVRNYFNGVSYQELNTNGVAKTWYAPVSAGTAGDILMSSGSGAPVWVTPATINGSAITAGGNIEIQGGGGDMSDYWTSAETWEKIDEVAEITAAAINELRFSDNDLWNQTVQVADGFDNGYIRNIEKIQQSQYDELVAQSAATETTLYVVIPDQE